GQSWSVRGKSRKQRGSPFAAAIRAGVLFDYRGLARKTDAWVPCVPVAALAGQKPFKKGLSKAPPRPHRKWNLACSYKQRAPRFHRRESMSPSVSKFVRIASIVGCGTLVAIQFIRPDIPHPPVTADLTAPPEVKQILRNSCYDCHSNETRLAWFDVAAPAYWLVARDVMAGRRVLNFSEIGKLPASQPKGLLYESVTQIQLY